LRGWRDRLWILVSFVLAPGLGSLSCGGDRVHEREPAQKSEAVAVGVTTVVRKPLSRHLTVSAELVPFQEIDVYAKEAGYVQQLFVDYGTRVRNGQLMAVLDIPELEAQLQQDAAAEKSMSDQVAHAEQNLRSAEAQHTVQRLMYERLSSVAQTMEGLVAQQEVDDARGRDLTTDAQVKAAQAALKATQSQLAEAKAKTQHDRVLYDYSRITAPFAGVVTQRYANLGTLMQAGTSSSTQAMPLVKLSQDDLFRLVIPVAESYVRYIHLGDPVDVVVPSLKRHFPGKVSRFSIEVKEATRTMHTEVDVPNPDRVLIPGVYAEATLTLEANNRALAIPLQAINRQGERTTVYVVDQNNQIQERPVTLGIETANYAELISGVTEGERVVISDRSGLNPGERVEPKLVQVMEYNPAK
jgi:RND family efflux transporter MFP subunit